MERLVTFAKRALFLFALGATTLAVSFCPFGPTSPHVAEENEIPIYCDQGGRKRAEDGTER